MDINILYLQGEMPGVQDKDIVQKKEDSRRMAVERLWGFIKGTLLRSKPTNNAIPQRNHGRNWQ